MQPDPRGGTTVDSEANSRPQGSGSLQKPETQKRNSHDRVQTGPDLLLVGSDVASREGYGSWST